MVVLVLSLLCCLFIRDSANCKLVRGIVQTSIMSVCTDYKLRKLIKWLTSNCVPNVSHYLKKKKKKKKRTDRSNRPIAFDLKKLISDELSRQICDGKKEPALHNLAQFLIYVKLISIFHA